MLMPSPIRALWETGLAQGRHPQSCSGAQGRGTAQGWLQARVPDPEHPQLRGGTKTVTVGAAGAWLIVKHWEMG